MAVFLAFYGSHMIPARPTLRRRLAAAMGVRIYLLLYALVSILLLAWLIDAAARAPFVSLWERAAWQNLVPLILMLPACGLAVFGIGAGGGLSLGSRMQLPFDPALPGIAGVTRHPLLWALALWSFAHLAPNGDLAHVLLFGSFGLTALLGTIAFDRRTRRRLGDESWQAVLGATAFMPFARGLGRGGFDHFWLRAFLSVAIYGALLASHAPIIGVSPT